MYGAYFSLRHLNFNMNTLIGIGTFAAYFFSTVVVWIPEWFDDPEIFFDAAVTIIVFVLLGKYMEESAKR